MARTFDNNAANYLSKTSAAVTAVPLTIAAWVNRSTFTTSDVILAINNPVADEAHFKLVILASDVVSARTKSALAGGSGANTTTTITATGWNHCCGVFRSATSRDAYLNGGGKGSNASDITPLLLDRMYIGATDAGTDPFDGGICEVALYNIALSDAEVALLAKPVSPLFVRPEGLVAYWPIMGRYSPEIDIVGGFHMTVNGTLAQLNHPRIYHPSGPAFLMHVPVGTTTIEGEGLSVGISTVTGIGAGFFITVGDSSGVAVATGVATVFNLADGLSVGIAEVLALSSNTFIGVGSSSGIADITGIASAIATAIGLSEGQAVALSIGEDIAVVSLDGEFIVIRCRRRGRR